MNFVIGSRGRLGRALLEQYETSEITALPRSVYEDWSDASQTHAITRFFDNHAQPDSVIYICSGLLDPKGNPEALKNVNLNLPANVISAATYIGLRVVTVGTAMEASSIGNGYVGSKRALSNLVVDTNSRGGRVSHIRIHTLYGVGKPSPFMFLGQMLESISRNAPFEMTMGRQLREYHHACDDAAAIKHLVSQGVTGIVELSHGEPVTLRSLAETIFKKLDRLELLRLGALPEPEKEVFSQLFERPSVLDGLNFRSGADDVAEYMSDLVSG